MKPEEVEQLPMYQAAIRMGALSPDHTNLSMTAEDLRRYSGMSKWRRPAKR